MVLKGKKMAYHISILCHYELISSNSQLLNFESNKSRIQIVLTKQSKILFRDFKKILSITTLYELNNNQSGKKLKQQQ